jgi:uncharacterized protein YlzI (FlbEa/FlbD family)
VTPKFIEVTRFRNGEKVMVNPRRLDTFSALRPPTQQPDLNVGTQLNFGRGEVIIVRETVQQIKTLLNK